MGLLDFFKRKKANSPTTSKKDRLAMISSPRVELLPPEYTGWWDSIFHIIDDLSLTANIENTSCKPESITLEEFYIVSGGEKFLPTKWQEYNEVEILPMSTRSCEQKWKCDSSHFITKGDYVIITLKSREDTHVFKFVYNGRRFSLDDYFKNFGEQGDTANVVNTNEYPETHSDSTEGAYMGDSNQ